MKKPLAMLGVSAVVGLGALAFIGSPAYAAGENCRTSVANISHRADRGFGTENNAVWAYKDLTRTTKVCQVIPDVQVLSELNRWEYQATVTDVGTFKTVGGDKLSPEKAGPLIGGVAGTFKGGFTARFSAAANFHGYNAVHDKNTYTGENPGNQVWVKSLFDEEAGFKGDGFGKRWGWTYTTGCETWKDVHEGGDDKDITGKVCPTPSASPSATATTKPAPVVTPSAEPTPSGQAGGLPVTGDSNGKNIAAAGAGALLIGALGFVVFRKKREPKFVAE